MSKRYGRNQKRKHREQIASLAADLSRVLTKWGEERHRVNVLETKIAEWNERIEQLLGRYSALRPELYQEETGELPKRGWRVPIPERPAAWHPDQMDNVRTITRWIAEFEVFLNHFQTDELLMRHLMRVELIDPYGRRSLALAHQIGGRTFLDLMADREMRKHFGAEIARNLQHAVGAEVRKWSPRGRAITEVRP